MNENGDGAAQNFLFGVSELEVPRKVQSSATTIEH